MSANARQVGGTHYKADGKGEEHWDRVARLGLDYFQACITKYVERCWKKNGVQDLRKAQHFLDKYLELKDPVISAFVPTHVHAEGETYRVLGKVKLHWAPHTDMPKEWVSAVRYCNAAGQEFVRLTSDFNARMTPLANDGAEPTGQGYVNQDR